MRLYSFYRSSAAYRVRLALALKGIEHEIVPIHLRRRDQEQPAYRALNPQGLVPALEVDGRVIGQSLAILEYLEERFPGTPLLPADLMDRAWVRSLAQAMAVDIHPLNNLRVMRYLLRVLKLEDAAKDAWVAHWSAAGLATVERMLTEDSRTGRFCHGDTPTLADVCLLPQVRHAQWAGLDVSPYPTAVRIADELARLDRVAAAHPAAQPDADPEDISCR
ncbi:maleylacetoacetate isomerase [Indioceanicola profundi]|uniref:maleylacetoacetate isomerase n=1 Tax=Indioceanicola profundi TaxID=2220096 RepID=UPI000E6AD887|nr:maleylacetoacetate isomerase [Indioceanicola profundi]